MILTISYLSFKVYHYIHTVYMHEHFSFSYRLIRSLLTILDLHPDAECFMLLIRCSMRLDMLRGAVVSLHHSGIIVFVLIPVIV